MAGWAGGHALLGSAPALASGSGLPGEEVVSLWWVQRLWSGDEDGVEMKTEWMRTIPAHPWMCLVAFVTCGMYI